MRIFKNKYGEIRSGWALAIVLASYYLLQIIVGILVGVAGLAVFLISGAGAGEAGDTLRGYEDFMSSVWMGNAMYYAVTSLTIVLVLLLFRLLYKRGPARMGLHRENWLSQLLVGCLFGIVSISVVVVLMLLTRTASIMAVDPARAMDPGFIAGICGGLVLFILVGFEEEILVRGYMMTAMKTTRIKWLILLLPALIFALMHGMNANVSLIGLGNILFVGILLACMFMRTGRLWVPIGFHITWNFFQGNVFGIAVSGMETPAFLQTVFTGPDWVTGGAFGAEGGILCTVVILVSLVGVRFLRKRPEGAFWSMTGDLPLTRGGKSADQGYGFPNGENGFPNGESGFPNGEGGFPGGANEFPENRND